MRLYRIDYGDCEGFRARNHETVVEWAGNKRDAERIARENHDGDYRPRITEIDVPTDKAGLIVFLNRTVTA